MELHMPHTHLHESYITVYLHTLILVIMESTHTHTHMHARNMMKLCMNAYLLVKTTDRLLRFI